MGEARGGEPQGTAIVAAESREARKDCLQCRLLVRDNLHARSDLDNGGNEDSEDDEGDGGDEDELEGEIRRHMRDHFRIFFLSPLLTSAIRRPQRTDFL